MNESGPTKPNLEILPVTTAAITPEIVNDELFFVRSKRWVAAIIFVLVLAAAFFRIGHLGRESLGEDELNKLVTANEYRENGLSGKNGEHPFLMKGLQAVSLSVVEELGLRVNEEAALRFPVALFGSFSVLLLFLLISELFGKSMGIIAAAFLAVEPMAIGFDRIAKEDSLVLFFFLLASLFWVRSQSAAELNKPNWRRYAWLTAAAFACLMASKYYPHLLAIFGAYYNVFKFVPGKRWNMELRNWLIFFAVMGITFLFVNPTIVLPETWHEMLKFSTENRIGHDSYEFMGTLYTNKMTAWLSGVPWTFYYVFIGVKTSLVTLLLCLAGLPLLCRKRMGDGRYYLFFWAFMWFLPFTFLGGKFVRYFTFVEPLIMIAAAAAVVYALGAIGKLLKNGAFTYTLQAAAAVAVLAFPAWNSIGAAPHYRMFTNSIGGGETAAGSYFPHDAFYDAATKEIIEKIILDQRRTIKVACETPALFEHYAKKAGRPDIIFVSLSDKNKIVALGIGDYVVLTAGRRYFSNTAYFDLLRQQTIPIASIDVSGRTAADIYKMDTAVLAEVLAIARR